MAFLQLHEPPLLLAPLLLLLCCCSGCSLFPPASMAAALDCFPPDLQALRAFAPHIANASEEFDDNYTELRGLEELWGQAGDDCCSWEGIHCSSVPSGRGPPRVSSINLYIYNFSNLSFTSSFLQPLCNLSLLSTLFLQYSPESTRPEFSTQLPACLGHLPNLSDLTLNFMHFQGPLPSSFSHLLHLQKLAMGSLLSGSLSPISNLPNLTNVQLSGCGFSGPLPAFQSPFLESLYLSDNFFDSTLQEFTLFSNLPSLEELRLDGNAISGSIPPSISRFSNLVTLDLSSNSLSGEIPTSFCELANLTTFHLDSQSKGGFDTNSLDSLQCKFINLKLLSLAGNGLTGPFPRWIGHSPSLEVLDLSMNLFRGPLPDEWRNLQNLEWLDLSGNSLLPLPDWLFRIPLVSLTLTSCGLQTQDIECSSKLSLLNNSLTTLDLGNNHLTGRDTLECFALHSFFELFSLDLSGNPLSIVLSDALFSRPSSIRELSLRSCNLKGIEMNSPVSLSVMDLSRNDLAMDLATLLASLGLSSCSPKDLSRRPSGFFGTNSVDLSHNALVGEIPSSLGLCNKILTTIRLHNNSLVGRIPITLGSLTSLAILTLNNNQLSGTIPASIVGLSSLVLLDLSYNELEGNLNTLFSVSNTTYLRVVLLSHNRINGSIPIDFGAFLPILQLIDFSNNRLTGIIPQKLNLPYLKNLQGPRVESGIVNNDFLLVVKGVELAFSYVLEKMTALDLSSNFLEGGIPAEMGDLASLIYLNLSHNHLSGGIPSSLSNLSQLEDLDLSSNELEGPLPSHLSDLTKLSIFNVSYNAGLRGSIPEGPQFESNESYRGNPLLCGPPALEDCVNIKPPASKSSTIGPPDNEAAHSAITRWINEWIALPGLCLGLVVGFATALFFLLHYKRA